VPGKKISWKQRATVVSAVLVVVTAPASLTVFWPRKYIDCDQLRISSRRFIKGHLVASMRSCDDALDLETDLLAHFELRVYFLKVRI
jgi:hypothetical protein